MTANDYGKLDKKLNEGNPRQRNRRRGYSLMHRRSEGNHCVRGQRRIREVQFCEEVKWNSNSSSKVLIQRPSVAVVDCSERSDEHREVTHVTNTCGEQLKRTPSDHKERD